MAKVRGEPHLTKLEGQAVGVKALVLGGSEDCITDVEGNVETAEFYGAEMKIVEGMAHDLMLVGSRGCWRSYAELVKLFCGC